MKLILSALLLCTTSLPAWALYDRSYYTGNGWYGEYANGFSVVKKSVKLKARNAMDSEDERSIVCEMPYLATYHPNNDKRPAEYRTVSKIVPLKAKKAVNLQGDNNKVVKVKKGEAAEYLHSGAEGEVNLRYKGKEYFEDGGILENFSYDQTEMEKPEDEWVQVTCVGGQKAWLLLSEISRQDDEKGLLYAPGLRRWDALDDSDQARDLTEKDLKPAKGAKR